MITPWNFPIAIPIWKLATALVCGNTIVWKPAENASLSATVLTQVFVDAGLSVGVLNTVIGQGTVVGQVLMEEVPLDAVSFTGSTQTGLKVADQAARRNIKYQTEMGGKNAAVVLADANLDTAVPEVISGAFTSAGQKCTATSRVIVEDGIYEEFTATLQDAVKKLYVGSVIIGGSLQLEDQNGNAIGGCVTLTASQISGGGNIIVGDPATGATLSISLNRPSNIFAPLFSGATGSGSYTQTDSLTLSSSVASEASTTQATNANGWQASTNVAGINIMTQSAAQSAITSIQNAINSLSSSQASLGAVQNRLNYTISNLSNSAQNLQSAQSTITNTDMASAYTQFSQQQVLEQVGISMLSQAQQQPQMILKLLQ